MNTQMKGNSPRKESKGKPKRKPAKITGRIVSI